MINLKINYGNLVKQLLPVQKRKPVRLKWLQLFIRPLQRLFDDFDQWRTEVRRDVNVNSQVMVLEGFLRSKYGGVSIKIETFNDQLLLVGLEGEGETMMPQVGLEEVEGEEAYWVDVPLDGELREMFGDTDFVVYIPIDVNLEEIQADIEKYKQATVTYRIIQR